MFKVFVRNWWCIDSNGELRPNPGARKTTIRKGISTEVEAQAIARAWNSQHKPGKLSRKAEYTDE
jgi:hypothetical protein